VIEMSCGCGRNNNDCCGEIKELVCYNCGRDIEKGSEKIIDGEIYCKRCK
jgi:hypothetical protein